MMVGRKEEANKGSRKERGREGEEETVNYGILFIVCSAEYDINMTIWVVYKENTGFGLRTAQ